MTLMAIPNSWGWQRNTDTNTNDTPTAQGGVSLPRGATDGTTKGAWTNISTYGSDTTIDAECLLTDIQYGGVANAATALPACMDIGVDTAGGTSYSLVASNVLVGQSGVRPERGVNLLRLPLRIPSGASVAARVSTPNTGGLTGVHAHFYGAPSRPESVWAGSFCESVGIANDGSVPSSNSGTSITPGNSGAWGSWASLGTTVNALHFWQLFIGANNATLNTLYYFFELYFGDGSTYVPIIIKRLVQIENNERVYLTGVHRAVSVSVPAGSAIYARATCSGTTDTGLSIMALGVG
jgi:hypothetical protein